ncbi:MAG: hypothetical protein ACXVJT_16840 [Thermoanaerobaculia bacterium]
MRAFGSDRVEPGAGAQLLLSCIRSKGWLARIPKTLTTSQHPGTAILWDERFFEVVAADTQPDGGVRYVLEPWRDEDVIRVSEAYDERSEQRREAEVLAAAKREKGRIIANLLGIFTGQLPAIVQQRLAGELGILPTRLTFLSLVLPFIYLIWWVNEAARRFMHADAGPMPFAFTLIAIFLLVESVVRLQIVWAQSRPVGSAAGGILYLLFYAVAGKRTKAVSPFTVDKGQGVRYTSPDQETELRDAYMMREPLLTLLSVEEQNALARRFGYDFRKHAFIVAGFLLVMSLAGVVTTIMSLRHGTTVSAVLSLLTALALGSEQLLRLPALRRGPTPSMLAFFIRPLTRKLLR